MPRRLWIQYYNLCNGRYVEAIGTDGLQPLDGRLGYKSAVQEAYSRAYQLRKLKRYAAFSILRGSRANALFQLNGAPIELPKYNTL